ncbi:MAG: hypothetical protein IKA57_03080, partial [Clostridia bacterium]|nr:hypothetical protein [Clostridia bacterium]
MKKIKKTLSVTLLMLGLVSIGAGAGVATNSVNVDPITANAELYPDWTCALDELNAIGTSTSGDIYVEAAGEVYQLGAEFPFTLHEDGREGFALNGAAFTPELLEVSNDNEIHIKLGFEAQAGDVLTVNGAFSNDDAWMTIEFNNCALVFDGSDWVAQGDAPVTPEVPDGYTTHTIGKLTFHVNSTIGPASGLNNQLYLQREDGEALPIQDWGVFFTHESGEGFKINSEAATANEIKSTDGGFFLLFNELQPGDVVSISGTFVCEAASTKYVIEESAFTWTGSKWEKYVAYTEYNLGAVVNISDGAASNGYCVFAGVNLPISSWDYAFDYVSGNGITVDGTMISMVNSVKSVGDKLYVDLGAPANVDSVLKIGGVFSNTATAVKYIIEDSEFKWDGSAWVPLTEVEIQYTTYTISKLEGANGCAADTIFAYSLEGDAL